MDCAETIQQNNFNLAKALVTQIDYLAGSQADDMCKIHFYETRPEAIENVLLVVKQMKLKIVTVVEQEVNHNGPSRRSEG
ncbi:hypothetical protein C1H46_013900 [Malus baccata]|uniref:Uncharacterized protein n=1 Tax=Malus baccata TaxID=106549 RepID=A0A540MNW6_MALBA|nr:hypothetical protein C1H46_013900 [Malus baccata]